MSARQAARDALVAVLPVVEESLDDDAEKAEYLLDVLAPHMAQLLIEQGGFVECEHWRLVDGRNVVPAKQPHYEGERNEALYRLGGGS